MNKMELESELDVAKDQLNIVKNRIQNIENELEKILQEDDFVETVKRVMWIEHNPSRYRFYKASGYSKDTWVLLQKVNIGEFSPMIFDEFFTTLARAGFGVFNIAFYENEIEIRFRRLDQL